MSFWITDAILSVSCFIGFTQLIARPNSSAKLAAVALGMLSLASMAGTLKFAFDLTGIWPELHKLASRLFGISGLYLLTLAWLDFAGILRVRLPFTFVHLADAALIFIVSRWLNLETNAQLVIGPAHESSGFSVSMAVMETSSSIGLCHWFRRYRFSTKWIIHWWCTNHSVCFHLSNRCFSLVTCRLGDFDYLGVQAFSISFS